MSAKPLRVGDWAKDTATGRVGQITEICGRLIYLAPAGAGDEWMADARQIHGATRPQELVAKIQAYNDLTRGTRR